MRLNRVLSLLSAAVMVTAAGLAIATPAQAEDPIVKLVSQQNGKCLQPRNASTFQGEIVVQMTCNGTREQQWFVHIVSNKVHLINRNSNLCLNAHGRAANGTPIDQWPCNTITNENWSFGITNNLLSSGISNTFSHCIATPGFPDGLPMELRFCDGNISQLWSRPNG